MRLRILPALAFVFAFLPNLLTGQTLSKEYIRLGGRVIAIENAQVAASIVSSAGTPQGASVNTVFSTALQATVRDAGSNPISGATVTFSAPGSGASGLFGSSATTTAITTSSGVATAPAFTANGTAGGYTVTATVSGLATPANFNLTNNAAWYNTAWSNRKSITISHTKVSGSSSLTSFPMLFNRSLLPGLLHTFAPLAALPRRMLVGCRRPACFRF